MSVRKAAPKFDVNPSPVQHLARPFDAEHASVAGAA
jgi:hypothetical protein